MHEKPYSEGEDKYLLKGAWYLWWVQLQRAVNTSSHAWQNDTSISFEALCPTIDEGNDRTGIQNSVFIAQEGYLEN